MGSEYSSWVGMWKYYGVVDCELTSWDLIEREGDGKGKGKRVNLIEA